MFWGTHNGGCRNFVSPTICAAATPTSSTCVHGTAPRRPISRINEAPGRITLGPRQSRRRHGRLCVGHCVCTGQGLESDDLDAFVPGPRSRCWRRMSNDQKLAQQGPTSLLWSWACRARLPLSVICGARLLVGYSPVVWLASAVEPRRAGRVTSMSRFTCRKVSRQCVVANFNLSVEVAAQQSTPPPACLVRWRAASE